VDIDLALLADAATIDASGKLNILGIFDRISATSFPVQHAHIALILRFVASPEEAGNHEVRIVLRGPDGEEVVGLDGKIQTGPGGGRSGGDVRVPQVVNMERMVFPKPGRYTFEVLVEGEHRVSVPLFLHQAMRRGGGQEPEQAPPQGTGGMGFGAPGGPVQA
jgi:hypothetical protein